MMRIVVLLLLMLILSACESWHVPKIFKDENSDYTHVPQGEPLKLPEEFEKTEDMADYYPVPPSTDKWQTQRAISIVPPK